MKCANTWAGSHMLTSMLANVSLRHVKRAKGKKAPALTVTQEREYR